MDPIIAGLRESHVFPPTEYLRVARQIVRAAIELGPLEEGPIHILADLARTPNHEPSLASVVSGHQLADLQIRAGHELRHSQTRSIVPLLPQVGAPSVAPAAGIAGRAALLNAAAVRAVPEGPVHARWEVVSQPGCHLVPAHR